MKKIIISLGSLMAISLPITAIIACGSESNGNSINQSTVINEASLERQIAATKAELQTKMEAAQRELNNKAISSLDKKNMLPSQVGNIDKNNILQDIFQFSSVPNSLQDLEISNINVQPNDVQGTLNISFKFKKSKMIKQEKVASEEFEFNKTFTNYLNQTENIEYLDGKKITDLTTVFKGNRFIPDFKAMAMITNSTMTTSQLQQDTVFTEFQLTEKISHNTPVTDRQKIIKYSTVMGIDLYSEPRLQGMEIISIQQYDLALSKGTSPYWDNMPSGSDGAIWIYLKLKNGTAIRTITVVIWGFRA